MRSTPLLLALALATTARADGERTLHLAVHGSIDGAALGAAIAKELGVEVERVDGTCALPCLDIAIDGKNVAAILFAPRSGALRQRSIKLGNDTRQWKLVVTLLAGNVVRDEAQDVLAGLPPAPLPEPPAPAAAPVDVPPAPLPDPPAPAGALVDVAPAPEQTLTEVAAAAPDVSEAPSVEAPGDGPVTRPEVVAAVAVAPPPGGFEPEAAREHRLLALGLVPGLSTDFTHVGSVRHYLSIDLLVGVSGGSSGLSISGVADIERGYVSGFQIAGVAALAQSLAGGFQIAGVASVARRVAGTQLAGVAAVAGELDGVQIAGAAAVADRIDGFQAAGVAAVSRTTADTQVAGVATVARRSAGTQVAGVAAAAGGNASAQVAGVASAARGNAGVQIAGVASAAGGDAGFQASGVTSVARGTANIQISGVVNVAHRVRGLQLGTINVAHEVDGVQIGVVNVGSADGFSFGLINIVPGGRYDLETAIDSSKTGTILFRHGGRRWHNVYGIGGHPVKEDTGPNDDVWMYGLGFGPSVSFDNTVVDLEAIGWQVNHGPRHESDVSVLGQLRLSVAHHWGPFAIVAGGVLNAYFTNDQRSPLILERSTTGGAAMDKGVTMTTWPSAFVGVRI